jgi:hypothetical protein
MSQHPPMSMNDCQYLPIRQSPHVGQKTLSSGTRKPSDWCKVLAMAAQPFKIKPMSRNRLLEHCAMPTGYKGHVPITDRLWRSMRTSNDSQTCYGTDAHTPVSGEIFLQAHMLYFECTKAVTICNAKDAHGQGMYLDAVLPTRMVEASRLFTPDGTHQQWRAAAAASASCPPLLSDSCSIPNPSVHLTWADVKLNLDAPTSSKPPAKQPLSGQSDLAILTYSPQASNIPVIHSVVEVKTDQAQKRSIYAKIRPTGSVSIYLCALLVEPQAKEAGVEGLPEDVTEASTSRKGKRAAVDQTQGASKQAKRGTGAKSAEQKDHTDKAKADGKPEYRAHWKSTCKALTIGETDSVVQVRPHNRHS